MATQQALRVCHHLKEDCLDYSPSGPSALNIARVPSELKNTGASTHCKEMPTSLSFRLILDFAMYSRDASRRNYPSREPTDPLLLPMSYAPNLQKPHNAHRTQIPVPAHP